MDECDIQPFSAQYEEALTKRLYGLSDFPAAEELGVMKLRRQPYLNLTGKGVVVGIADTGIDYTHPVFRKKDGSSRILAIWDQSAEKKEDQQIDFGRIYFQEEINRALRSEDPLGIVPVTDENGHGTFMAGLAAGNEVEEEDFTGIATGAELVVVKLRQAEACLKQFWFVARETEGYVEQDIAEAVTFLAEFAAGIQQPLVILLGISSNQGDHNGLGRLSAYLEVITRQPGYAVVLSGGNEGNAEHHFQGRGYEGVAYQDVEIRIANVKEGLYIEFWADAPDLYGIGFVSPTGELVEKLPTRVELKETISFVFEPTVIDVTYDRVESLTGATLIRIRMINPTSGIWKIRIYQEENYNGRFDLWMPITAFIQGEAQFLKPEPNTTITEPGNSDQCMTVTAYSMQTGGIYLESSRGFTRDGRVKPDFTAPGVGVKGPIRGGLYVKKSGSSVAAALAAGSAALLLEYRPEYTGVQIKNYFIRGAQRGQGVYPSKEMGWGKLNIYETFEKLRIRL